MATTLAGPTRTSYRLPRAGAVVAFTGTGLGIAALILTILDRVSPPFPAMAGLSPDSSLALRTGVQTVGLVTLSTVAGLVAWRQPRNLFSWVLGGTTLLLALGVFAGEYAVHGLVVEPGSLPLADVAAWSQKPLPGLVGLGAILALLLFPDGHLKSPRWRLVVGVAATLGAANIVANLTDPYPIWTGL